MRKRTIDRDLVVVLTTTLITIAAWVGFEVYRAYTKVSLPEGVEKYLQTLNPTLNVATLDQLEQRSSQ
ncbi:MAG: hypothetical protein Q7S31_00225 [bacterium]|nr:hypothetical protein [bacterium]